MALKCTCACLMQPAGKSPSHTGQPTVYVFDVTVCLMAAVALNPAGNLYMLREYKRVAGCHIGEPMAKQLGHEL